MPDADKPEGVSSGDSPKYLTLEDAKSLISETVNRALTSHVGRALSAAKLKGVIREVIAEHVVEQEQERPEQGAEGSQKEGEAEGAPEGSNPKGTEPEGARRPTPRPAALARKPEPERPAAQPRPEAQADNAPNAEVEGLKRKVTEMEANWRKAQKQAEQERQRAIEQKGYADLRGVLGTRVRPDAVSLVTDVLRSRGMVVFDDDGQVRLKVRAALAKGEPEEDHVLDIESGVAHFLGTKEGALFVPPPSPGAGAAPTGSRRPSRDVPAPRPAPTMPRSQSGDKLADIEERTGRSIEDLL